MATHCGRTDYWLISYLDYDNYKDYDDFDKDYDDDYDDYDGDYDVLNLTQLLMQNSHSLLLSSSIFASGLLVSQQHSLNDTFSHYGSP